MSLPKGFKRLEYIQSSGTQYVDTLFKPNQNTGVTIDFQLNAVSDWQCVFGARNTANNVGSYALWHSGSAFGFYFASANKTWSSLSGTARHTVVANKNEATANGTDSVSITFSEFTGNYSLLLFAANSAGSVQSNASMKLYSCQIYDNGTLVRDFVPCQNASGAIGLWDAVNEVFYANAGTGTFTAGPVVPEIVDESEITELEYIQSSGTQYADTRFAPNQDTRTVMDFNIYAYSAAGYVFGCRGGGSEEYNNRYGLMYNGTFRTDYGNGNGPTFSTALVHGERRVMDKNKAACTLDSETLNNTAATFQSLYNMALFGIIEGGAIAYMMSVRLYSCQIYDNGLLERDYVPAMLANGEVGLYDRVYHEFYRNAGTGEFTAGPEMAHEDYVELEYIESSGAECVNTGVFPTNNSRVVMDAQLTSNAHSQFYFGARTASATLSFSLLTASSVGIRSDHSSNSVTATVESVTDRFLIDRNKNVCTIGDVTVTNTAATFETGFALFLLALNYGGNANYFATGKLFSVQIYDDDVEVRIYVSMLHPSGVAGLWDSVNERFYASATTTDFLAGPEAQTVPKAPANFRVESETDTLVTLAWDPMEEVLGYRLYRQGRLLADTTEPFVSVTVEPFAGAVFTLAAYNENGEGTGTSLTYYSIPENPLLYLITDRTQQDVSERNPKGYYAASDLNRVGYAMDYLANIIRGYGYKLEVETKTDWTDEDWKLSGEMVKYLQSLNNLKAVFSTLVELPETMEKINYVDANNIEQLLLTIDETVARVVAGFTRANAFALRSGSKGLPVSQSDRGRNWGELDAMETTWANWQLATWYLLLYGNLKAEGVVE